MFSLIGLYFRNELNNVKKNGIKINIIGNVDKIPKKFKDTIKQTIRETKNNKKIVVNLAINYGSKNEIVQSVKKLKKTKITEENIDKNLQTRSFPDPDILIRTGGKKRLSNFMLWQLAYSEIYFLDKLWPDFTKKDLNKIIKNFKSIKEKFRSDLIMSNEFKKRTLTSIVLFIFLYLMFINEKFFICRFSSSRL